MSASSINRTAHADQKKKYLRAAMYGSADEYQREWDALKAMTPERDVILQGVVVADHTGVRERVVGCGGWREAAGNVSNGGSTCSGSGGDRETRGVCHCADCGKVITHGLVGDGSCRCVAARDAGVLGDTANKNRRTSFADTPLNVAKFSRAEKSLFFPRDPNISSDSENDTGTIDEQADA